MIYFNEIKIGNRVWSFEYGWGTLIEKMRGEYPLAIKFDKLNYIINYNMNGTKRTSENQTLFWNEIKFDIPERPKIKLKRDYSNTLQIAYFNIDNNYASLKQAKKYLRLLALRDQECVDSRGYEFQYDKYNFYIFENKKNFHDYSFNQSGNLFHVYFKTKEDAQKICDILNSGRFNLEGD